MLNPICQARVATAPMTRPASAPPNHLPPSRLAPCSQEFHPYVFQIFAQLIEVRPPGEKLPDTYLQIFPPLLAPIFWERSGNVPALVRLLQVCGWDGARRVERACCLWTGWAAQAGGERCSLTCMQFCRHAALPCATLGTTIDPPWPCNLASPPPLPPPPPAGLPVAGGRGGGGARLPGGRAGGVPEAGGVQGAGPRGLLHPQHPGGVPGDGRAGAGGWVRGWVGVVFGFSRGRLSHACRVDGGLCSGAGEGEGVFLGGGHLPEAKVSVSAELHARAALQGGGACATGPRAKRLHAA